MRGCEHNFWQIVDFDRNQIYQINLKSLNKWISIELYLPCEEVLKKNEVSHSLHVLLAKHDVKMRPILWGLNSLVASFRCSWALI